jgi:hypothetical protein
VGVIDFSKINWRPQWEDAGDVVVWVSVPKVNVLWRKDRGFYLSPRACPSLYRYQRFGEWIQTNTDIWMSHLGLYEGRISFADGRHRFAWFRDHGLESLPVTTARGDGAKLRRAVGR